MADAGSAFAAALRDVVVRYPGRAPLGPVDLSVAPGEILTLVGASGAGKSTLLRLLAGLERPSEGTVSRGARHGRTGFVFQNATLMPWADIQANVALPLELSGVSREEASRALSAWKRAGTLAEKPGATLEVDVAVLQAEVSDDLTDTHASRRLA